VVVDEAQDLSPMQLRMLARRCPLGSMTILGDLAQGTGVWAHDSWDEVIAHLPAPDGSRVEELRLGYRSPAQVLDLAARLLPWAAPQLRPTEAVRPGRTAPAVIAAASDGLLDAVAAEATALAAVHGSVGVVVPGALLAGVRRILTRAGLDTGDDLTHRVSVMTAAMARGLEFDAVVVVEPAAVVAEAPGRRGVRHLYVALTRPTRHLSVVHSRALPGGLAA
jgi:DNA helicase IV